VSDLPDTAIESPIAVGLDDAAGRPYIRQRSQSQLRHGLGRRYITHSNSEEIMEIQPIGDRILVKTVDAETKTSGGIYIPETAQEKTQEGVVLAVGDDEEIKVKKDDKIIYDKYAGTTIKVEGEEQLIIKAADVLAVVT